MTNINSLDVIVLACRPVELNDMEIEAQQQTGLSVANPYSGSVKKPCGDCDREVWAGPRQQAIINSAPDKCLILCLTCAVIAAREAGIDPSTGVKNLGNPETP